MEVDTSIPLDEWQSIAGGRAPRGEPRLRRSDGAGDPERPVHPLAFAAAATERIRLGTAVAIAFPRSPMIVANLGYDLQRKLARPVRARPRYAGERSQRAPLQRALGVARAASQGIRRGAARDLAVLGAQRAASLRGQILSIHADDSGIRAAAERTAAGAGDDRARSSHTCCGLSGEVCDGVRLHGFCTKRYLQEVALPAIDEGLRRRGADRTRSRSGAAGSSPREAIRTRCAAPWRKPVPDRLLRLDAHLFRCALAARLGRTGREAARAVQARSVERDGERS